MKFYVRTSYSINRSDQVNVIGLSSKTLQGQVLHSSSASLTDTDFQDIFNIFSVKFNCGT